MFTHLSRPGPRRQPAARTTGTRLDRLAAVLTAVTCGLLTSAATIPAAYPKVVSPGEGHTRPPASRGSPATARIIMVGGMAGWQIAWSRSAPRWSRPPSPSC